MSFVKRLHVIRDGLKMWLNVFVTCLFVAEMFIIFCLTVFAWYPSFTFVTRAMIPNIWNK